MFSLSTKASPNNVTYPDATIEVAGSAQSTNNLTTYTFNNVGLGTANTNRMVVVVVQTQATVSSVTIAGTTATLIGTTACFLAYANVPTGTTGTVVVTHTASTSRCYIDCFAIVPGQSMTPYSTAQQDIAGSSKTIDVPKGGIGVFLATNAANSTSFTTSWSGSDTKISSGSANGSGNFYWVYDYFASPFASSYTGTYTSGTSTRKAMVTWR